MTGADPRFLERGFICIKVWGVRFADFISFFFKISHAKRNINLVLLRSNDFIFIGSLQMRVREGVQATLPEPPLDPPFNTLFSSIVLV